MVARFVNLCYGCGRMMNMHRWLVALLLPWMPVPAPGIAAPESGVIQVLDPQRLPIPGARLLVARAGRHRLQASLVADERGTAVAAVNPPVEIRVEAVGFETTVLRLD